MALCHKQVLPAVVVKVFQASTPAGAACGERSQTGFQASIGKEPRAVIVVKTVNLTRKYGHKNVWLAVVVVVLKDRAHTGECLAVSGERRAGLESAFGKRPIAVVVEKVLLHAVVGDEDVRETVVVIIGEGHA